MPQNQTQDWYQNPVYRRYWEHYQYSMEWIRKHKQAYWKAKAKAEEYENRAVMHLITNSHFLYNNNNSNNNNNNNQSFQRIPPSGTHQTSDLRYYEESDEDQCDQEGGDHNVISQDPVFEMEITDDILDFLEKSERHREELRTKRREEAESEETSLKDYEPPKEQIGARRTAEMKQLYGKYSAMIHGMETAMQLTFDRHCDLESPKFWPNIPLNL